MTPQNKGLIVEGEQTAPRCCSFCGVERKDTPALVSVPKREGRPAICGGCLVDACMLAGLVHMT